MIAIDHEMIRNAVEPKTSRAIVHPQSIDVTLLSPTVWIEGSPPVIGALDDLKFRIIFTGCAKRGITITHIRREELGEWVDDCLDARTKLEVMHAILDALREAEREIEDGGEYLYVDSLDAADLL